MAVRFPHLVSEVEKETKGKDVKKEMKEMKVEASQDVKCKVPVQQVQFSKPSKSTGAETQKAKNQTLDYSKWSNIVDSDEEDADPRVDDDVGVKDLAEGALPKVESLKAESKHSLVGNTQWCREYASTWYQSIYIIEI